MVSVDKEKKNKHELCAMKCYTSWGWCLRLHVPDCTLICPILWIFFTSGINLSCSSVRASQWKSSPEAEPSIQAPLSCLIDFYKPPSLTGRLLQLSFFFFFAPDLPHHRMWRSDTGAKHYYFNQTQLQTGVSATTWPEKVDSLKKKKGIKEGGAGG